MESQKLTEVISQILDDKRAIDIEVVALGEAQIADYFVIATGKNTTHVRALAEELEGKLEENYGIFATRREGTKEGRWAVVDYDNVIVHIFNAETRDFYCLEQIWKARVEKAATKSSDD